MPISLLIMVLLCSINSLIIMLLFLRFFCVLYSKTEPVILVISRFYHTYLIYIHSIKVSKYHFLMVWHFQSYCPSAVFFLTFIIKKKPTVFSIYADCFRVHSVRAKSYLIIYFII